MRVYIIGMVCCLFRNTVQAQGIAVVVVGYRKERETETEDEGERKGHVNGVCDAGGS